MKSDSINQIHFPAWDMDNLFRAKTSLSKLDNQTIQKTNSEQVLLVVPHDSAKSSSSMSLGGFIFGLEPKHSSSMRLRRRGK
jgi:hypothetical protein